MTPSRLKILCILILQITKVFSLTSGLIDKLIRLHYRGIAIQKSGIYLMECEETDDFVEDLFQLFDDKQIAIRFMQNLNQRFWNESTLVFCSLPNQPITSFDSTLIFLNDDLEAVKKLSLEGKGNSIYIFTSKFEMYQMMIIKSVFNTVKYIAEVDHKTHVSSRINLQGMKLEVGYIESSNYLRMAGGRFEGSLGTIFELMSSLMNFTINPIPSYDGYYGSLVMNGTKRNGQTSTHNGLIGMLERGEIDVAITDLSLTFQRAEVADFGGKMVLQPTVCLLSISGTDLNYLAYIKPFNKKIWFVIIVSTLGLTLFTLLLSLVSYRSEKNFTWHHKLELCLDILAFAARTMSTKDNFMLEEKRYKNAWRILLLTYLVFGYFVVVTYNAELTSNLTSSEQKPKINQLEDILENDMKLSLPKGSFYVSLLESATEGDYKKLWDQKVSGERYGLIKWGSNAEDEVLKAIKENYLVLGFGDRALDIQAQNPCDVARLAKDPILPTQIGIYLQKNSDLTQLFQHQLRVMRETGVVDTIIEKKQKPVKPGVCSKKDVKLGIESTVFLFICVSGGCLVAALLLLLEILTFISTHP